MTTPFEAEEIEALEIAVSEFARTRVRGDPPLHCFPLRGEWERARPQERVTHPEPEVRGAWGVEMPELAPEPVLRLAELAREAGWEVRVSYARGRGVHGTTGRPTALQHNIGVAFGQHPMTDAHAVATYVRPAAGAGAWSWRSVWIWGPALPHFGLCSLAELQGFLRTQQLDTDAVRERVRIEAEAKAGQDDARKLIKELRASGMSIESICTDLGLELEIEEVRKLTAPAKAKKESG